MGLKTIEAMKAININLIRWHHYNVDQFSLENSPKVTHFSFL